MAVAGMVHEPVLTAELLECLKIKPEGVYFDGTYGSGGHARAVKERLGPKGVLIACDRDPGREGCLHANFAQAASLLKEAGFAKADGMYLDLGVSSMQLDQAQRGFSFMRQGPLDMRMDTTQGETLKQKLWRTSAYELAKILREYGEERLSEKIARSIIERRGKGRLDTTRDLADAVVEAAGPARARIHPATRTFQALRIWVNAEMENLKLFLDRAPACLNSGGRLCLIAYHSLEDRLVKRAFVRWAREEEGFSLVTKKPIRPSAEEIKRNPRARSAKLRCLQRN